MKLDDLMAALQKLDGLDEKEVNIYYWDFQNKRYVSEDFSIQVTKNDINIYLVQDGQPECMVGGHDDGCMCNLGFTPRWRNK